MQRVGEPHFGVNFKRIGAPAGCENRPMQGRGAQAGYKKIARGCGCDGGGGDISETTAGCSRGEGSNSRGSNADDFSQQEGSSDIGEGVKIVRSSGCNCGCSHISDTTGGCLLVAICWRQPASRRVDGILAKVSIFARISMHRRVSFEFIFWQFLASKNGDTE